MDFQSIFLQIGSSLLAGIAGGLAVVWFQQGVHIFGKGFKFNNQHLTERYIWKYSFIFCVLFLINLAISIANFYLNQYMHFFIILIIEIISGLLIILTIISKFS